MLERLRKRLEGVFRDITPLESRFGTVAIFMTIMFILLAIGYFSGAIGYKYYEYGFLAYLIVFPIFLVGVLILGHLKRLPVNFSGVIFLGSYGLFVFFVSWIMTHVSWHIDITLVRGVFAATLITGVIAGGLFLLDYAKRSLAFSSLIWWRAVASVLGGISAGFLYNLWLASQGRPMTRLDILVAVLLAAVLMFLLSEIVRPQLKKTFGEVSNGEDEQP